MFKRALVAASVFSAFAIPAMAEVTVYGSVRTGVEYSSVNNGGVDQLRLADQSSRLGFKGSDKLDNGMTALFKVENRIRVGASNADNSNNATAGWGNRDTYVGIQDTKLGTLTFGKQLDAYSDWSNAVIDNAYFNSEDSLLYQTRFTDRVLTAAKYVSPTVNGFTAEVSYDFGSKTADKNNNGYAGLVTWANDKVSVGVSALQQKDTTGPLGTTKTVNGKEVAVLSKNEAYALVGSYKFTDAWSVGASYEKYKSDELDFKVDQYSAGVAYAAGKWGANAWYLKAQDSEVSGKTQSDSSSQVNVNVHYSLSKNTMAGVAYTYVKDVATVTAVGGPGYTANVVSVNLRTDF